MKLTTVSKFVVVVGLAATFLSNQASATLVLCKDETLNHMLVDDAYVSACVDSGYNSSSSPADGNIGNGVNDDFLNNSTGAGWVDLGEELVFTQTGSSGTFSLNSSLWDSWDSLAVGFKFGTGNEPDSWFVYNLQKEVSSGNWYFGNVFDTGGGLSHGVIYGSGAVAVPEPGTLGLMGIGLLAVGLIARRRK